ncbi:MAG: acetolactate synthase small subunit [Nitrospinota bacterium]|jgi:acetolactate synthase-1/3 small subunit|nr:acetolactate synthase small subunit [Nitrospinota bacterium]MDP7580151.1 acetolactate synthase small subunit [Nitrospinota bacterium]HJN02428.1 acetolactate synthase small subunit [Nitrospinota bacterium]
MKHTISVLVENKFGVLSRISSLFSGRGFNIESLSVAETMDTTVSRMTIVTRGSDQIIEQVTKQLNKLVDVIKVNDLTEEKFIDREMVLVKVDTEQAVKRDEVLRIVEIFRCKVADVSSKAYTIEVTGDEGKIKAIVDMLKPIGIKEIVRTGRIAMTRGSKALKE